MRGPFQRDRDRIIHSNAFRRLKHKTQVFLYHEGDHYRTRLTHTLEVAQVARSIARLLGLDEDLTEAIALAHDLGHPPFGHAGEAALNEVMAGHGGFDHNIQSLRVVTKLERRYPDYDGLNLTRETLDGIAKHNGPLAGPNAIAPQPADGWLLGELFPLMGGMRPDLQGGLEAQAAAIADDIAYASHDIEDGLRAGLLQIEALSRAPLTDRILARIRTDYPGLDDRRTSHEITRRLITLLIEDVVVQTWQYLKDAQIAQAQDVLDFPQPLCRLSPERAELVGDLKAFLYAGLYRHKTVTGPVRAASHLLKRLFDRFMQSPQCLPPGWGDEWSRLPESRRARRIADYVAGMTDRYLLADYERLFDEKPELG